MKSLDEHNTDAIYAEYVCLLMEEAFEIKDYQNELADDTQIVWSRSLHVVRATSQTQEGVIVHQENLMTIEDQPILLRRGAYGT